MWKRLFRELGFHRVIIHGHPGPEDVVGGQHVIIAVSNGQVIREVQVKTVKKVQVLDPGAKPKPVQLPPAGRNAVEKIIIKILATVLQIPSSQIKPELTYSELGVDSILAAEIVNHMNGQLGISLKPTDLFNCTPPAMAISLVPQRILSHARCTASKDAEQAVLTVTAGPFKFKK